MNYKITIAIDAMGGENAPKKNIEGISIFLKKNTNKTDFFFNLYGDENLITKELKKIEFQKIFIKFFILRQLFLTTKHH